MKYTKFVLLSLTIISLNYSCSPTKKMAVNTMKSGIIEYALTPDLKPEAEEMAAIFGERLEIIYNDKMVRSEYKPSTMGSQFYLTHLATGEQVSYIEAQGKKFALNTNEGKEDIIIQPTDGEKTIVGYKCQRGTANVRGEEIEVFYTHALGVNYNPFGGPADGFVLEYTMPLDNMGRIKFTAKTIDVKAIAAKVLETPEGYKKVTRMELQRALMGQQSPIPTTLEEGKKVENFKVTDIDGKLINLAELQGKVVVLNFWFTACRPCVMEMPHLNELTENYKGKPVEFISITFDKKAAVEQFLQKNEFTFQKVTDERNLIGELGVMAFPTNAVLDKSGKIILSLGGFSRDISSILSKAIDKGLE